MQSGNKGGCPQSKPGERSRYPDSGQETTPRCGPGLSDRVFSTTSTQQHRGNSATRYWDTRAANVPRSYRGTSEDNYNARFAVAERYQRENNGLRTLMESTGFGQGKGKDPEGQEPRTSLSSSLLTQSNSQRGNTTGTIPSVPSGFGHLLNPQQPPQPPGKLQLVIRQQPRLARACAAGEKGRCLDPVPILQLLITDFDPSSEEHIERLAYKQYVVGCQLFSISKSSEDGSERRVHTSSIPEPPVKKASSQSSAAGEAGSQPRSVQVLFGKTYVSPFFVEADPEPERAPPHPRSTTSPSWVMTTPTAALPSTFFIFSDLCVRMTGLYRLRFRLVDVGGSMPLGHIPVLDEVWSDPFRVYAAKDFPGMGPTPYLAEQLKMLGVSGIKSRGAKGQSK